MPTTTVSAATALRRLGGLRLTVRQPTKLDPTFAIDVELVCRSNEAAEKPDTAHGQTIHVFESLLDRADTLMVARHELHRVLDSVIDRYLAWLQETAPATPEPNLPAPTIAKDSR